MCKDDAACCYLLLCDFCTRTYVFSIQYLDSGTCTYVFKRFNNWQTNLCDNVTTNYSTESSLHASRFRTFLIARVLKLATTNCASFEVSSWCDQFSDLLKDETYKNFLAIEESSRLLRPKDNENYCVSG